MEHTVFLRPGTPNDENRDYLPEAIKGSDMVVNENGNNSHPYPQRLIECTGVLTEDGLADRWYEYIPASYDGSKPVPLIVGNHGGLMTGWVMPSTPPGRSLPTGKALSVSSPMPTRHGSGR